MESKCFSCFSLVLLSIYFLNAQEEWAPINTEWHYSFRIGFSPEVYYTTLVSVKDTSVNNQPCHLLSATIHADSILYSNNLNDIIIYQDSQRVYRWIDDGFHLLYDFNLHSGDTLKIYIEKEERGDQESDSLAYLIIDSTSTFDINSQLLNAQYLRPLQIGLSEYAVQFAGWTYEKIGNGTYFVPLNQLVCDDACPSQLRCYTDPSGTQINFTESRCDTVLLVKSSVTSEYQRFSFDVYPNPIRSSDEGLWLEKPKEMNKDNLMVYVYDYRGQLITSNSFHGDRLLIPSSMFQALGLYYVAIYRNNDVIDIESVLFVK